jgi:hypothetical protein
VTTGASNPLSLLARREIVTQWAQAAPVKETFLGRNIDLARQKTSVALYRIFEEPSQKPFEKAQPVMTLSAGMSS